MLLSSKLKLPNLTPLLFVLGVKRVVVPLGVDPLKVAGADQTSMVGVFFFLH